MEQTVMVSILVMMSLVLCYAFVKEYYYEIRYSLMLIRERIIRHITFSRVK